jgi:uncharacterized protein YlaI
VSQYDYVITVLCRSCDDGKGIDELTDEERKTVNWDEETFRCEDCLEDLKEQRRSRVFD